MLQIALLAVTLFIAFRMHFIVKELEKTNAILQHQLQEKESRQEI